VAKGDRKVSCTLAGQKQASEAAVSMNPRPDPIGSSLLRAPPTTTGLTGTTKISDKLLTFFVNKRRSPAEQWKHEKDTSMMSESVDWDRTSKIETDTILRWCGVSQPQNASSLKVRITLCSMVSFSSGVNCKRFPLAAMTMVVVISPASASASLLQLCKVEFSTTSRVSPNANSTEDAVLASSIFAMCA